MTIYQLISIQNYSTLLIGKYTLQKDIQLMKTNCGKL